MRNFTFAVLAALMVIPAGLQAQDEESVEGPPAAIYALRSASGDGTESTVIMTSPQGVNVMPMITSSLGGSWGMAGGFMPADRFNMLGQSQFQEELELVDDQREHPRSV